MRLKKENEALCKMKRNPKYFYKYANSFSKNKNKVGPLMNEHGDTVKDPYLMAEILRKQYESTFSTPDPDCNIDNLSNLFFSYAEREEEQETEQETEQEKGRDKEQEKEQS